MDTRGSGGHGDGKIGSPSVKSVEGGQAGGDGDATRQAETAAPIRSGGAGQAKPGHGKVPSIGAVAVRSVPGLAYGDRGFPAKPPEGFGPVRCPFCNHTLFWSNLPLEPCAPEDGFISIRCTYRRGGSPRCRKITGFKLLRLGSVTFASEEQRNATLANILTMMLGLAGEP